MNPAKGYEVIFLNHDTLDCRKENLKVVTTVCTFRDFVYLSG